MKTQAFCSLLAVGVLLAPLAPAADAPAKIPEFPHRISCVVTDPDGTGIQGASVMARRRVVVQLQPEPISKAVLIPFEPTNADGRTTALFAAFESPPTVTIKKDGYYTTRLRLDWKRPNPIDQVHPSTTEVHATLKKIKNPIPMHAISNIGMSQTYVKIPRLDQTYGFDLKLCAPLPPLGSGEVADFYFKVTGTSLAHDHYDLTLDVNFANPEDGMAEFFTPVRRSMKEPRYEGSQLLSDYEAPEKGYVNQINARARYVRDEEYVFRTNPRRNFYFRCRTKKDASGKVISAHYGKIYGDLDFGGTDPARGFVAVLGWTCSYFNPTPNDRNVEFDTKRNLNPGFDVSWP